jgi:hypothetical protein
LKTGELIGQSGTDCCRVKSLHGSEAKDQLLLLNHEMVNWGSSAGVAIACKPTYLQSNIDFAGADRKRPLLEEGAR